MSHRQLNGPPVTVTQFKVMLRFDWCVRCQRSTRLRLNKNFMEVAFLSSTQQHYLTVSQNDAAGLEQWQNVCEFSFDTLLTCGGVSCSEDA